MLTDRRRLKWVLVGMVWLCGAVQMFGQGDGALRGLVRDPSSAVVPGARVTAMSQDNGTSFQTQTTGAGVYQFSNLLVGRYDVSVEASGFQTYVRRNVEIHAGQIAEANASLMLGEIQSSVEVITGGELVSSAGLQLGGSIDRKAVMDLPAPLLGSNALNLALMYPNVTTQGGGLLGAGGSIGGLRPRANNFTIDGVDNNDVLNTGPLSSVIQDSVAEFSLLTNQFSAEFGHSAGGQFQIVTRSGGNEWRGSASYFGRNRNLNANDRLVNTALSKGDIHQKPRYDSNRAGATLGGPLMRDKVFIFGAYEYQTVGRQATGVSVLAPTSAGLSILNSLAANDAVRDILRQMPTATAQERTATVNGQAIPIGSLQVFAPDFLNRHDFQANMDATLRSHQLRGRFLFDRGRSPWINPILPLQRFTGDSSNDNQKVVFTDIWTLSPHLLNDLRASYSRNRTGVTPPDQFRKFPNIVLDDLGMDIGPERNAPQVSIQNAYQLLNNLSVSAGPHQVKAGGEYRWWIVPVEFLSFPRGLWEYRNLNSLVNDLTPDGLNGALRGAGLSVFSGNQKAVYWFAQDDVRVTPDLTLNLGLRYEWTSLPRDASLQEKNAVASLPGIFEFRVPKSDRNNFAPRVGFAYAPRFQDGPWRALFGEPGRTAIRGGFGVAYDVSFQNLVITRLPPQLQTIQNPDLTCAASNRPAWCATQQGFLQGGGLLQTHVPPLTVADARNSTSGIMVDQTQPKVLTWSLDVQRQIAEDFQVEVRYLGTRGLSLPAQLQLNAVTVFERNPGLALPTYFDRSEVPTQISLTAPNRAAFLAARSVRYPDFGPSPMTAYSPVGRSSYHAGSVELNRRFSRGLWLKTGYTWSRTIDNSTVEFSSSLVNPRRPQDSYNLRNERGLSALDRPHKWTLAWVYDIPLLPGGGRFATTLLKGWRFSGTYLAESGQPITALSGVDANGNRDSASDRAILNPKGTEMSGSGVDFVVRDSATGATSISSTNPGNASVVGYVARNPRARFVVAEAGAVSTVGRNTIRTPGLNNFDLAVGRQFGISESVYLQLRVEMFNALNHRQPSLGLGTVEQFTSNALSATYANASSPRFLNTGQFAGGSRSVQYSLRLLF